MKWRPRMDLHHQPPDPKSGALRIELQGYWRRLPVLPRPGLVYKTSAWLLCQAGMKRRKPVDMLHNPQECGSVRFPTGGGTLVRFGFQKGGCPGWIRTISLPGQSRALCC